MEATTTGQSYSPSEADNDDEPTMNAASGGSSGGNPMTLDIVINNVVCNFNVKCHLDLRRLALHGTNVEYRRENGMVTMKIRKPYTTASIWSSGKVSCTGATSEEMAKVAARRFARTIQNLGFRVSFTNYRVVNVLGTCTMPFAIRIIDFSKNNKPTACYEPELHPGVTYKIKDPKATMKIFSTGSITVTAPSVASVQAAIEYIFPLVYEYRNERPPTVMPNSIKRMNRHNHIKGPPTRRYRADENGKAQDEEEEEDDYDDDEEEEEEEIQEDDSDASASSDDSGEWP